MEVYSIVVDYGKRGKSKMGEISAEKAASHKIGSSLEVNGTKRTVIRISHRNREIIVS